MQLLFSVIDELYTFALDAILGLFRMGSEAPRKIVPLPVLLPTDTPVVPLNDALSVEVPMEEEMTFRSMEALLKKNRVEPAT